MARTLLNLQTELNQRVDDDIDTDNSKNWLNASWQEVLDYYPWPFLVTAVTGTLGGSTASQSFSTVFSVTNLGRIFQFMVSNVIFSRIDWVDKDVTGQYQVIAISPDNASFVTPGSETGTGYLKYLKMVSDLSVAGDTLSAIGATETGVPTNWVKQFEEAVIAGAATRYFQQALKPNMAQYWASQRDYYLDGIVDQFTRLSEGDMPAFRPVAYNETSTTSEF